MSEPRSPSFLDYVILAIAALAMWFGLTKGWG